MHKAHDVARISFRGKTMLLSVDGRDYEVDISQHSRKLANASADQKRHFIISPSGYGIHWPELDEDLSIDGLIGVTHAAPTAGTTK